MKKLLTLFTLLLTVCSGAWADQTWDFTSMSSSDEDGYTDATNDWKWDKAGYFQNKFTSDNGTWTDVISTTISQISGMKFMRSGSNLGTGTIRIYKNSTGNSDGYLKYNNSNVSIAIQAHQNDEIKITFGNTNSSAKGYVLTNAKRKSDNATTITVAQNQTTTETLVVNADGQVEFLANDSKVLLYKIVLTSSTPSTPTLTGAWKIGGDVVTSASVVQGGSATMPTFTVGATSGTPTTDDYSVAYDETGDAGIFTYTAGVPTGINTTVTGSATVTATLTAVGTNYEAPTTNTFTYTVTVNAMLTQNSVSTSRTWDWSKLAAVSELTGSTNPTNAEDFVMANMDGVRYPDFNLGFNSNFTQEMAQEIVISKTQWVRRSGSGDTFQNGTIKINFAVPGKLTVYFTGTNNKQKQGGDEDPRYLVVNSSKGSVGTNGTTQVDETFDVVVGDNTISFESSKPLRIQKLVFTPTADAITVTPAGLATYASNYNLDFSGVAGIKAYKASIAGKTITFEKMDVVPAGEGMLIRAMSTLNENTTFYVPHKASASQIENAMKRGEGTAVAHHPSDNIYNYVLSGGDNGVGFYRANGETVPTDRAYLQSTEALAKGFVINYDDEEGEETDGIKAVSTNVENGVRYNLAGQKVGADYKGIVIVNGKKMLNK